MRAWIAMDATESFTVLMGIVVWEKAEIGVPELKSFPSPPISKRKPGVVLVICGGRSVHSKVMLPWGVMLTGVGLGEATIETESGF